MTKQGLYKFQDGSSTGVELVPINGYIFIENTGGSNKSIMIIDKSGITSATTIDQLLALTSQWVDIGSSGGGVVTPSDMDIIRLRHTTSLSVDSTSPVDITWDTQEEISDSFTFSGSEITIIDTGIYHLSAGINYNSPTTDRYSALVTIIVNGTPLSDNFRGAYIRKTDDFIDTGITVSLSLSLTAGDKVKIATQRTGIDTTTDATLIDGTNVSMIHLTGEKGADGADGQEGAAGSGEGIPIGGIIMYNGAFSAIPANYNVCDGSGGTPDLRGQFVVGATIEGDIGDEGGSNTSELLEHNHDETSHTHTTSMSSSGSHDHTMTSNMIMYDTGGSNVWPTVGSNAQATNDTMNLGGNHTHSVTVNSNSSTTTSKTGSTNADNRPAFYTLAYIRRMS